MALQHLTPAFILRRNLFRDTSLLLDLFTLEAGKITCVASFSKGKGIRTKGMLEPFRCLDVRWQGRGEVLTLAYAEETQRYPLQGANLLRGVYANELLLRALWAHQPQPELFARYQQLLQALCAPGDPAALPLFELDVLATAGLALNLWQDDASDAAIQPTQGYRFVPEQGLVPAVGQGKGVAVSGRLLVALREPATLPAELQVELRQVLDQLVLMLLKGKTLNARRLLPDGG